MNQRFVLSVKVRIGIRNVFVNQEGNEMKFFVCKKCGYADTTHSNSWKVKRSEEDAELVCLECGEKEFLKIELTIKNAF